MSAINGLPDLLYRDPKTCNGNTSGVLYNENFGLTSKFNFFGYSAQQKTVGNI